MQDEIKQAFFGIVREVGSVTIAVIGDIMLDQYIWGTASRISPEAPVPIVDYQYETDNLGGAGNVVKNLSDMGATVYFFGSIGMDGEGERVKKLLEDSKNTTAFLIEDPDRNTTTKRRTMVNKHQLLRIDREVDKPLSEIQGKDILQAVSDIPALSAIIISDYACGVCTPDLCRGLIEIACNRSLPVLIDPKRKNWALYYRRATIITPNREELFRAVDIEEADESAVMKAVFEAIPRHILLTEGDRGMTLHTPRGWGNMDVFSIPAHAREVFDVSGAGDTVLSIMAIGMALGYDVRRVAEIANIGAGIVVGKIGTQTVTLSEIEKEIDDNKEKRLSLDNLSRILVNLSESGKKVVLATGCFDLLHYGHIHVLQEARKEGDLLVVGLNSDSSVRQIKGPKRPIWSQEERAACVASLACVDYVAVFDETTPEALIHKIKPDVFIKGEDWKGRPIPEQSSVELYGGKIEFVPRLSGFSTTKTIEHIRG